MGLPVSVIDRGLVVDGVRAFVRLGRWVRDRHQRLDACYLLFPELSKCLNEACELMGAELRVVEEDVVFLPMHAVAGNLDLRARAVQLAFLQQDRERSMVKNLAEVERMTQVFTRTQKLVASQAHRLGYVKKSRDLVPLLDNYLAEIVQLLEIRTSLPEVRDFTELLRPSGGWVSLDETQYMPTMSLQAAVAKWANVVQRLTWANWCLLNRLGSMKLKRAGWPVPRPVLWLSNRPCFWRRLRVTLDSAERKYDSALAIARRLRPSVTHNQN